MTGPEPTMDELVELGAKAAWKSAIEGDSDGDPHWSWEKADVAMKQPFREDARSILTAVLPRVLEGAREALAGITNTYVSLAESGDCGEGNPEEVGTGKYRAQMRLRGKILSLGLYERREDAIAAVQAARAKHGVLYNPDPL